MSVGNQAVLDLHAGIYEAFKQSAKAGWAAVSADVPMVDVRVELDDLWRTLSPLPRHEEIARDHRFLAFRRARLAVKSASESAVMLEPAFCDPVMTQEKSFASYHDGALDLASELAGVLLAEFGSIQQEKRLPTEQMCRTASQVPHENLGAEGVYWLRILTVYDEYCAGLLSEAAYLYESGVNGEPMASLTDRGRELSTELSVLKRPQASENSLFPNGPPADDVAERCILHLFSRRDGSNADLDILRDFFKGDIDRAKAMQVEIRRLRSEGITTLLVNRNRVKGVKRP